MRTTPLSSRDVILAIERFAPQARPYNFDDMFDCWGFQRRLFDYLDEGWELNGELDGTELTSERWEAFEERTSLLPGDILTSHPRPDQDFHTVIYAGRIGDLDLVYDASSRGRVPLFHRGAVVADRPVFTRFMRGTETTERLRHDGGAYLRLWDDRVLYRHRGLHARLAAGNIGADRDLAALRRAAGLTDLPFYCRMRLATDAHGRELYDNRETCGHDYYSPGGAPLEDDAYEAAGWAEGRGAPGQAQPLRPAAPALAGLPHRIVHEGDWTVSWRPGAETESPSADVSPCPRTDGPEIDAWRVELWEETHDRWKRRLLRADLTPEVSSFTPPRELLRAGGRFAVVLFAHDVRGWSGSALATALWRPEPDNVLLGYNANRPTALRPGVGEPVREQGQRFVLAWSIPQPAQTQVAARVRLLEDACLADDAVPLLDVDLAAPEAAACRCVIPAALLRSGHTYAWYVDALDAAGRWTFAPSEGVFIVE